MKKKIPAIIMLLIIMLSMSSVQAQAAYTSPYTVKYTDIPWNVAPGLVAAGLTYHAVQDGKEMVEKYWNRCTPTIRAEWQEMYSSTSAGVSTITQSLWNDMITWVDANFNAGDNAFPVAVDTVVSIGTASAGPYYNSLFFTGTQSGVTVTAFRLWYEQKVVSGSLKWVVHEPYQDYYVPVSTSDVLGFVKKSTGMISTIIQNKSTLSCSSHDIGYEYGVYDLVFDNMTGDASIDDPGRDFTNTSTNARKVAVPSSWITADDVITGMQDKTVTDLVNQDIGEPLTADETQTGILDSATSTVAAINAAVTTFFDLSQPIDLSPFQVTGSIFTTKFPFSLPWDVMHAFSAASAEGAAPNFEWKLNVPMGATFREYTIPVDLTIFNPLLPYIRILELFLFDLALVLLTPRLLGGDQ